MNGDGTIRPGPPHPNGPLCRAFVVFGMDLRPLAT